jgi:hypothetical protein
MKAPKHGTKRYKAVMKAGCGGYQDPYDGDYDCTHDYEWSCDECPVCYEVQYRKYLKSKADERKEVQT